MRELLARCSSRELTEWMAYERISGPLGPERADLHMAILAATVSNTARGKGRKAEPKDFLPQWDQGAKQSMNWEDMLAAVKTMNRRLGGADLTQEGGGDDGADPGGTAGGRRDRHGGADHRRARRS
ncbi:phage tail assembly protein T [Streptomyces sp. NPDC000880]